MRIFRLCLVGLAIYLISVVVLFPAAPVIDRIRPQLGPIALEGVNGKLFKGVIDRVRSTDDLLPWELQNVAWALAPQTLLKGGAGASIRFDAYGGEGRGQVLRRWNGDIVVSDFDLSAKAKALEPLLPVPIASFNGDLLGKFDSIVLSNNLLSSIDGRLTWNDAVLESPVPTALGSVNVIIQSEDDGSHSVTLSALGGDVAMDGSVKITASGDFDADVLFTPASSATPAIINGLRQMGRADAKGRVRFQRQGNVNRLM